MDIALTVEPSTVHTCSFERDPRGIRGKIGDKIRDRLFFSDLGKEYNDWDMVGVRQREIPRGFNVERDVVNILFNDTGLRVHLLFFHEEGGQGSRHFCLRIGGKTEDLEIGAARLDPYLKAYQKNQQKLVPRDFLVRANIEGVDQGRGSDSEDDDFEVVRNPEAVTVTPLPPTRVQSVDRVARLTMIQMSFYDIESGGRAWRPKAFSDFGDVAFLVLGELDRRHQKIDSLICHAHGSAVLEGIERREAALIPQTIILDRAMPSVFKALRGSRPWFYRILFPIVRRFGWAGDPEKSLKLADLPDTQILQITATHDIYFSGMSGWEESLAQEEGEKMARFEFSPSRVFLDKVAHHSAPLSFYKVWEERRLTSWFSIRERESVVDAVARQVFIPFNFKRVLKEACLYVDKAPPGAKTDLYLFIEQILHLSEFQRNPRSYLEIWADKSGPIADLARQFLRLHF